MKKSKDNPPKRLYYKFDDKGGMIVTDTPSYTPDAIFLNWNTILEKLDEMGLDPDIYWRIREMLTSIH